MLGSLGKQQLAEMAETLIELTSFKRKISMETDSVGGPVDIAIISKYEGDLILLRINLLYIYLTQVPFHA